ncbi:MAG: DNA-binding response regulator [Candidatus Omnitrophota bacterium]|jgi:DNA-binding NarL/FixJ family response regulator|nr:MAG: DNA-binding response regulator [Candidatus Omnitrophota bacterium]
MKIRILLADDHIVMRDGIRALLEKHSDFEVVAVASNGRETLDLIRKHDVDVVVMDISMPHMTGIEAAQQIKSLSPKVKVLALSVHTDNELVARMIEAGASGYLPKSCEIDELIEAIHTVMKNRTYLSPSVVDSVFKFMQKEPSQSDSSLSPLTPRERDVLQKIAEGKTTKETASLLCVSDSTVESHRQNIMKKLDIHTIAELTKYAIRHGLTSIES